MDSEKNIRMLYHTSIRNIALYTSVSFAALAYAREYKGNYMYAITLTLISICFTVFAGLISTMVITNLNKYKTDFGGNQFNKHIIIPYVTLGMSIVLLTLGTFTLIRRMT